LANKVFSASDFQPGFDCFEQFRNLRRVFRPLAEQGLDLLFVQEQEDLHRDAAVQ